MKLGVQRYLTIRNEFANENYSVEFIRSIFDEESKGLFSTRVSVLGHLQQVSDSEPLVSLSTRKPLVLLQGERPSPFDRNQATKLAARAAEVLIQQMTKNQQPDGSVYTDASKYC